MHDCFKAEKAGKPTALICNRAFGGIARATARLLGISDENLVLLPQLLASQTDEQVAALAEQAMPSIVAALTEESPGA